MERTVKINLANWHFAARVAVMALQKDPHQPDALALIRQMADICAHVETAGIQARVIDLFGSRPLVDDTDGFPIN